MKTRNIIIIAVSATILVVFLAGAGGLLETNSAGYLQVKQAAVTGSLTCRLDPGMYGQFFGDIHTYPEATTFHFTADVETGENKDQSLPTMFNDGAAAKISGSVRIILPTVCEDLVKLHRKFKSIRGVNDKLILPAIRKALFNTGPHMSAAESYAARRGEFATLVEDQLINGTILVKKRQVEEPDPITGEMKKIWILVKKECNPAQAKSHACVGSYWRDRSAFKEFNVRVTNLVIDQIKYSPKVLAQIEIQRKARMDIITQQAQARQAEARAAKANAEAKAQIAETRAKEEVQKTQRVVKAEADKAEAVLQASKRMEVASLNMKAEAMNKKANILKGEGEATQKRLIMQADGALTKKLKALTLIHKNYAAALGKAQPGALVPQTIIGGSSGKNTNSAASLIDLLLAKTAKDLSIDVTSKSAK
jgi:regulator of protease activity HflC (stomatin/prohibitin superfamily)